MKKALLLLGIMILSILADAQGKIIRNLVFEGSGIRGIAYCGAVQELESKGLISNIEKVGGTSAGAITALCISLGYNSEEITKLLYNTNFKKFNDGSFFFVGGINRLFRHFGWYRGKKFAKWIGDIIEKKTGDRNISFEELNKRGFKELYITATMLNEQRLVVLSHKTYPQMQVKDAVRISVGIPFYFEAILMDDDGKVSRTTKNKKNLNVMVDGGFIGNFPIHIFDSVVTKEGITTIFANDETLGFRVDRALQIENDKDGKGLARMPISDLKEYGFAFYSMIMENLNRQLLTPADWKRTVSISDGDVRPRIRKLSKEELRILIANGRTATREYFK